MRRFCFDIRAGRVAITLAAFISMVSIVVQINAQRLMVPGIDVPNAVETGLRAKLQRLEDAIDPLRREEDATLDLLPDVEIYHKAVAWALEFDEFIREREFEVADVKQARSFSLFCLLAKAVWVY